MLREKRSTPYKQRLCIIILVGFCVSLCVLLFGSEPTSVVVESQSSTDTLFQIRPGTSIRLELATGGKQVIELPVDQGTLLRVSIEKGDLCLSTVLYAPSGTRLLEHVSQELETVTISFPADISGSYKIEFASREKGEVRGPIKIRVEPLIAVTQRHRRESEALQLMAAAEVLRITWRESDLRSAIEKYDKAALIWTSISDFSNASLASLKAGNGHFLLSNFAEAFRHYKKASQLGKRNADRLSEGRALSQMGLVSCYMGKNDLARKHVNEALALLKGANKDESPITRKAYGEALANMAEVIYTRDNFLKASDLVSESENFFDSDRKGFARAQRLKAYITGTLGNLQKAETAILRALELSRAIDDKVGEGSALTLQGTFYAFTGKPVRAFELHEDARNIFRSVGDLHSEAIAINGLGQVHQVRNDRTAAIMRYEEALHLFESTGALDSVAVATFKLASLYVADDQKKALDYFERSIALSRAVGNLRNEANALSEIAIVYASHDRPDQAAKQHRKVQKFYESIGDYRGQAIALNNYGDFLFDISQRQQALEAYLQALPFSERVKDHGILTTTLYNLARTYEALGDHETALSFIERSIRIIEDLRADIGSPDLRALYFSGVRQHYDLCRDILMQLHALRPSERFAIRAFLVSEKGRARSLLELVNESQKELREGATLDLLRREGELGSLIRKQAQYEWDLSLDGKAEASEIAEVSKRLAQLNAEYQQIQTELRVQNPRQSLLIDFELRDLAQVQNALSSGDTVLLEYGLGNERSYLWAITSDSFQSYELAGRKTLEDATTEVYELMIARQRLSEGGSGDYQANVETADNRFREKARALSQMLLGPVAGQLGNKRLVFVTEGALQFAPFEAFAATGSLDAPEKFLTETNEIVALPSISTLLAMRAAQNRSSSHRSLVAIIADPVFSRSDDRVDSKAPAIAQPADLSTSQQGATESFMRSGKAPRLIYSSAEADAISALSPRGTTLVAKGFNATRETAMSSRVGEYQIVHFATHGFFNSDHPELSSIVLTMVDQNGVETNGLMPLHDIYNLDLSAQLTVLSACQTGLGKDLKGEGLVGLTHSFMSAGSKSVVASRWKVDDRATAVLMSYFYESMLREGLAPAAALRDAKVKMIQDSRWNAPYFWAGFVFQGDYESRINVDNDSNLFIFFAIMALVLICSVLIVFLRRRQRSFSAG